MTVWLALAVLLAGGGAPHAPKLDVPATPLAAPAGDAGARRLPPTVAVCQDRTERRCWTAPDEAACGAGRALRVVIDDPAEIEATLAHCRRELEE